MTKPHSRRQFLQRSAGVVAAYTAVSLWTPPPPLLAQIGKTLEPLPPIEDPRLKALVERGIDASKSAGATYADVRLTHEYRRGGGGDVGEIESMTVGVRALVNGYWGFASGPVWSLDEMVRLGQEAVLQAKANGLGKPRVTTLAPTPVVSGHWTMPIQIDPFSIHPAEVYDRLIGISIYAERRSDRIHVNQNMAGFFKQDKAFGSSDGSYCTQRNYLTSGLFLLSLRLPDDRGSGGELDFLDPAGVGFELFEEQRMRAGVDRLIEDIKADLALPVEPVEVGRYDTVVSARPVAHLLGGTVGVATELDRALGYEANAGGTSYLNDPFEMLGTFKIGSPLFTVTMNRDQTGGAATTQWDDEGVVPETTSLIKDGVVNDMQTTRESAGWMQEWLTKHDRPIRSTGSAYAPSGVDAPLAHTGNLVLTPSTDDHTLDTLVSQLKNGVLFTSIGIALDFQQLNGMAAGKAYKINNGKKVALLDGAGILFRTPELWKSLSILGGPGSAVQAAGLEYKGQPGQTSTHTITAVPAMFTQQTIIDSKRKA